MAIIAMTTSNSIRVKPLRLPIAPLLSLGRVLGVEYWVLGTEPIDPTPNTQHPTPNTQHPTPNTYIVSRFTYHASRPPSSRNARDISEATASRGAAPS